jgi:quercetin dioxygenase-like cupin family protein
MKWLVLAMVLLRAVGTDAQDAVATVPGSYTRQFENDWVRIVRVHYAPLAKLPAHTHPALACAYVYLNDSGPVVFRHIGSDFGSASPGW